LNLKIQLTSNKFKLNLKIQLTSTKFKLRVTELCVCGRNYFTLSGGMQELHAISSLKND